MRLYPGLQRYLHVPIHVSRSQPGFHELDERYVRGHHVFAYCRIPLEESNRICRAKSSHGCK